MSIFFLLKNELFQFLTILSDCRVEHGKDILPLVIIGLDPIILFLHNPAYEETFRFLRRDHTQAVFKRFVKLSLAK